MLHRAARLHSSLVETPLHSVMSTLRRYWCQLRLSLQSVPSCTPTNGHLSYVTRHPCHLAPCKLTWISPQQQEDRYFNVDSKLAATQLLQEAVAPTENITATLSTPRLPFSFKQALLMRHGGNDADAVLQDFVDRGAPTPPTTPTAVMHVSQHKSDLASTMHTSTDCWCGATDPPFIAPAPPLLPNIPSAPAQQQVAMAEIATAPTRSNSLGSFNPSLSSLFSVGSIDSAVLRESVSVDPDLTRELESVSEADLEAILTDNPSLTEDFLSLFTDPAEVASHMGLGDCVGDMGDMNACTWWERDNSPYPNPPQSEVHQATATSSNLLETDAGKVTGRKRKHDKVEGYNVTYDEEDNEIILLD